MPAPDIHTDGPKVVHHHYASAYMPSFEEAMPTYIPELKSPWAPRTPSGNQQYCIDHELTIDVLMNRADTATASTQVQAELRSCRCCCCLCNGVAVELMVTQANMEVHLLAGLYPGDVLPGSFWDQMGFAAKSALFGLSALATASSLFLGMRAAWRRNARYGEVFSAFSAATC